MKHIILMKMKIKFLVSWLLVAHGHKQFDQILNLHCNSLAMGKALFQILGNLIFQVHGYFNKDWYFFHFIGV